MLTIDQIKTIVVCGAGTMGAGIAQVAAMSGYYAVLYDLQTAALEGSQQRLEEYLDKAVSKGRMTREEKAGTLQRYTTTADINKCQADVVIEAIVERPDIKKDLFRKLAEVNGRDTIFASNTSSLSISLIAKDIIHPERVAGMHFFNPAPLMKLVEIVSGDETAPAVAELLYTLAGKMGKTPVMAKDTPGFIVNRVARHYYLEAMQIAAEGVADYKKIDRLMESAGFRMGPFALMDLIGNDINLAVTRSIYTAYDQAPRFTPSSLQIEKVEEGALGKKTGKGFYNYL
ncbi:3-hydroxyacyl-CoA dehydrogenase NAD-binding domain-containing protein [Chitinophaga pinensis]|uniref:3-hydroxybutyryl-CoA dehydrogenase n=1 Tax=Chitinophaga pinensis (strain ATCC 43595 / DSM 2588 / LMG 13176 / NBRC 15968 / NCIMB 11800 / UQM 2034) TaxID=485918 RepID=A0A979GQK0_CHIPD|nr:3-hydroxyacyl-CoA dehydrogenase NAD-binding domain-containing protein [Chitinophaga pinensis]ACU58189.1 3-hydroxybutyryl-CoA dehydrogenase [Chitinophaga pinensis DSM 2588]